METNRVCLELEEPIRDAISAVRFAPKSNHLLISSWDSILRLYDVDSSLLRLEASSDAALLDCCFQNDSVVFSAGSDGFIRRYDLHVGTNDVIGKHEDIATCLRYSDETDFMSVSPGLWIAENKHQWRQILQVPYYSTRGQVLSAGLDKKIISWDVRLGKDQSYWRNLAVEVDSMSLSGFDLIVATGASVIMYDLRNLDGSVQSSQSLLDVQIRCVSSIPNSGGYVVGSIDGRVAVGFSSSSNSNRKGYAFRCHPKSKDGRNHLVSVNDIVINPLIKDAFLTGDNEGYVIAWDAESKRRLFELPEFPNSVASLSFNQGGELLAVASSYTYHEAMENEKPPQMFIHKVDVDHLRSDSVGSSRRK